MDKAIAKAALRRCVKEFGWVSIAMFAIPPMTWWLLPRGLDVHFINFIISPFGLWWAIALIVAHVAFFRLQYGYYYREKLEHEKSLEADVLRELDTIEKARDRLTMLLAVFSEEEFNQVPRHVHQRAKKVVDSLNNVK